MMKKYTVQINVDGSPEYEVIAENQDKAIDEARERFSENTIMWTYGTIIDEEDLEDE